MGAILQVQYNRLMKFPITQKCSNDGGTSENVQANRPQYCTDDMVLDTGKKLNSRGRTVRGQTANQKVLVLDLSMLLVLSMVEQFKSPSMFMVTSNHYNFIKILAVTSTSNRGDILYIDGKLWKYLICRRFSVGISLISTV